VNLGRGELHDVEGSLELVPPGGLVLKTQPEVLPAVVRL
jgi:hypothetical protein